MQLREYTIPKTAIPLPGKPVNGVKPSFDVRGLCLDDMTFLISLHHGPITRAIKQYQESREDILATGNINNFLMTLVRDFPQLATEVISAAHDSLDEETRKIVAKLPLATQIMALTEITKLTLDEVGGLKNLLAEAKGLVDQAQAESESATARPEDN